MIFCMVAWKRTECGIKPVASERTTRGAGHCRCRMAYCVLCLCSYWRWLSWSYPSRTKWWKRVPQRIRITNIYCVGQKSRLNEQARNVLLEFTVNVLVGIHKSVSWLVADGQTQGSKRGTPVIAQPSVSAAASQVKPGRVGRFTLRWGPVQKGLVSWAHDLPVQISRIAFGVTPNLADSSAAVRDVLPLRCWKM